MVASEPNAHQAGDQEHITTIEDSYKVVGFLVGSYFIAIMNIRIPHAIKIWSCLFTLKNILKLRRSSSFSWNIFSIEMEQQMYVIYHSQNTASDQLPNQLAPKRGSQRRMSFDPNPTWWAYPGNCCIVQAWDILSRGSYQPIVLASLWSHLWSPAAN